MSTIDMSNKLDHYRVLKPRTRSLWVKVGKKVKMARKRVLCFATLMLLISGLLYGFPVGTSNLKEATGLNHTSHIKHWHNSFTSSIVYQSMSGSRYCGHYVLYDGNGYIQDIITFGGTYNNVAYPAIAISQPIILSGPIPVSFPVEAIVYLSGDIGRRCVYIPPDSVCFPLGDTIKIAFHNPLTDEWDYQTVWVRDKVRDTIIRRLGIPSIAYAYQTNYFPPTDIHFIITFLRHYSYEGYDHDLCVVDWTMGVDNSGNLIGYIDTTIVSMGGQMLPINPSTAAYFLSVPDTVPPAAYLHTVWRQPLWPPSDTNPNPGAIGYRVLRRPPGESWECLGTVTLEIDDSYFPPPAIYHFHPHISRFGDRIFLSWRMENHYNDRLGEIVRRRKSITHRDDEGDELRYNWEPSIAPSYDDPEPISTWEGYNSDSLDSDYPQGSLTSVVWQEEWRTPPYDWEMWLHDREPDPDYGSYDWGGTSGHGSELQDVFPNVDEQIVRDGDYIDAWCWVLWTRQMSSDSYRVECVRYGYYGPWGMPSSKSKGSNSLIQIAPYVPVFYVITCGDSIPSFYCKKRDGYDDINGYPVDKGTQELIYHLPLLEPPLYYLIRAIVIAPDTISETFSFDSVDTLISVTIEPETLDFILPDAIYKDRYVRLTISGENGAYLSNIKIYQYEVIQDTNHQSYQDTASSNPSILEASFSISPNIFSSVMSIKYGVTGKGMVSLEVYNAAGRLVKVLERTYISQRTAHSITWRGDDDKGKLLSAGVYFIKLETESSMLIKKAILIK